MKGNARSDEDRGIDGESNNPSKRSEVADGVSRYLREMRTYMPPEHRAFIESLERRTPVRAFVESSGSRRLISVYNACVEALDAFRALHLQYAATYIFNQAQTDPRNPRAVGTGGTPFMDYLKKHRDETSATRLD